MEPLNSYFIVAIHLMFLANYGRNVHTCFPYRNVILGQILSNSVENTCMSWDCWRKLKHPETVIKREIIQIVMTQSADSPIHWLLFHRNNSVENHAISEYRQSHFHNYQQSAEIGISIFKGMNHLQFDWFLTDKLQHNIQTGGYLLCNSAQNPISFHVLL